MWTFPLFPDQASSVAGLVDAVYLYVLGIVVFFTVLICVLILFLSVRYRRGARADRSNPLLTSLWLEVLWIGIPLILAMSIFVLGFEVFYHQYEPPSDAATVYVVGKQWMWYLQH